MDCRDDRLGTSERGGQNQVHHHPTPAGRSRGCVTGKHGGKVFMFRVTIARGRLTVPITCSLLATMLPFSAATVDAVSSNTPPKGGVALYQDAVQDPSTGAPLDPAPTDPTVADAAPDSTSKEALSNTSGSV